MRSGTNKSEYLYKLKILKNGLFQFKCRQIDEPEPQVLVLNMVTCRSAKRYNAEKDLFQRRNNIYEIFHTRNFFNLSNQIYNIEIQNYLLIL